MAEATKRLRTALPETSTEAGERIVVDVRNVPPAERHPRIFGTYAGLHPGQAFVLVNDHDPKPLYYQFQAEHTGEFNWEYLEAGPTTWRVLISRRPLAETAPLRLAH